MPNVILVGLGSSITAITALEKALADDVKIVVCDVSNKMEQISCDLQPQTMPIGDYDFIPPISRRERRQKEMELKKNKK